MTDSKEPNYDDDAVSDAWCAEMRLEVVQYVKSEDLQVGEIGEWPAWHAAPYVSVWAIESVATPGFIGTWVLCGDLPTDRLDDEPCGHPRVAMAKIAERWKVYVDNVRNGRPNDEMEIESGDDPDEMLEMLLSRAEVLLEWASDDELWDDDEMPGDDQAQVDGKTE